MNIMIINGSPKKKGGASAFFAKVLRCMLFPHKVTIKSISISKDYRKILDDLQNTEVVVISAPLYVDSIPAHFIHFLKETEQYCKNNKCGFMLYVISNAGFVGGHQNQAHLEQYKCWCERTGITWGGGLGIGGGVMLNVLFKIMLITNFIQFVIEGIINIIYEKPLINNTLLPGLARSLIILLFLYSGMLFCEFIFARAIRNKKSIKNLYTRIMLPSFLFMIVANIFMFVVSIIHLPEMIFHRIKYHC